MVSKKSDRVRLLKQYADFGASSSDLESKGSDGSKDEVGVTWKTEDIKKWNDEILKERKRDKDFSWGHALDLWRKKLEKVEFEDLTFGPNSALNELRRCLWISGLDTNGYIGYECVRCLGGLLVAVEDCTVTGRKICVVNEENLVQYIENNAPCNSKAPGRFRQMKEASSEDFKQLLNSLRSCKPEDLIRRLQEERCFGFIIPFLRLRFYKDELLDIARIIIERALQKDVSTEATNISSPHLEDLKEKINSEDPPSNEFIIRLLDVGADRYQRNNRVFEETLRNHLKQKSGNDLVIVDPRVDSNECTKLTELDKWYDKNQKKGSEPLSLKTRRKIVKEEKEWFKRIKKIAVDYLQEDSSSSDICSGEPDFFALAETNDAQILKDEGTSRDTFTHKILHYCSRKQRLRELREAASLVSCLTAAAEPSFVSKDTADGERERIILVIGYSATKEGVSNARGGNEPFVAREINVLSPPENERSITEIGARLDGLYAQIPDELCELARERIFNSSLSIREETDTLVFYEFIPTGLHAVDSAPLERILAQSQPISAKTQDGLYCSTDQLPSSAPTGISEDYPLRATSPMQGLPSSPVPQDNSTNSLNQSMQQSLSLQARDQIQSKRTNTRTFTHILLEMLGTPYQNDDPRWKGRHAYRNLEETSGRRFLISLKIPGKVEMEGMRLPSIAVMPRSSVAPDQNNLSFRRYLLLLPATQFGFDTTAEEHDLRNLLHGTPASPKGIVETAETLAQVLSILIQLRGTHDPSKRLFELLKSNHLILNCMSVKSLISIKQDLFKEPITRVWKDMLGTRDGMTFFERAAVDSVQSLIIGHSASEPATGVFASEEFWGFMHDIVKSKTTFNAEDIDIEPSNFWSVLERLSRRTETSVPSFYFVRLTGKINAGMLEKLLGIAHESHCVKLVFFFSKGLMALYNRLPGDLRSRLFLHDHVQERAKDVSPVIIIDRLTPFGCILPAVSTQLRNSNRFLGETLKRIHTRTESALKWKDELKSWFRGLREIDQPAVHQYTHVLVSDDPEFIAENLCDVLDKQINLVNARDPHCIEKLRGILSVQDEYELANEDIVALSHAQLLARDRLQVIATHCAARKIPLLLITSCASRDLTSIKITMPTGGTTYESLRVLHVRMDRVWPKDAAIERELQRVILGLRILLGPGFYVSEKDIADIREFCKSSVTIPACLSEIAVRTSSNPRILHNLMTFLYKKKLSTDDDLAKEQPVLVSDLVALALREYLEIFIGEPKVGADSLMNSDEDSLSPVSVSVEEKAFVHFSDVTKDPVMMLASQETRLEVFLTLLKHETEMQCLGGVEDAFNIGRVDNPGEILCSKFGTKDDGRQVRVVDPGRGDSMTPLSDIIEQSALRGEDLDWNHVYNAWARTPEVSTPVLQHLLEESPLRLLLALSLSKTRMSSLPLNVQTVERLTFDLDCVRDSLGSAVENNEELLHRRAVLAWSLLKHQVAFGIDAQEQDFARLVNDFLKSDLFFDFKSGNESDNLKTKLIKTLVSLDFPPHALIAQPHVAELIFTSNTNEQKLVNDSLGSQQIKFGAAFAILCLHSSWRDRVLETAGVIRNCVRPLRDWAMGSSDLITSSEEFAKQDTQQDMWYLRFSPAALAEFIAVGSPKYVEENESCFAAFITKYILKAAQHNDDPGKFLLELLSSIAETEDGIDVTRLDAALRVCVTCASSDIRGTLEDALNEAGSGPFQFAVYSVLRQRLKTEDLGTSQNKFPLTSSKILMRIFIKTFVEEELSLNYENKAFFSSHGDRETLLNAILSYVAETKQLAASKSLCELAWFAWAANPTYNLPLLLLPNHSTEMNWDLFSRTVCSDLPPACKNDNIKTEIPLSMLAVLATMPHTLPGATLNALQSRFIGNLEPIVKEKLLILAQKDNSRFSEYALRIEPGRDLPRKCIEYVLKKLEGDITPWLDAPRPWDSTSSFPRVQEGFSVQTLKHNLRLFTNLSKAMKELYQDNGAGNCVLHTGATLLMWFMQAGLTAADIIGVISANSSAQKSFREVIGTCKNHVERIAGSLVFCPLPVSIDTRFVDNSLPGSEKSLFDTKNLPATAQQILLLTEEFIMTPSENETKAKELSELAYNAKEELHKEEVLTEVFKLIGQYVSRPEFLTLPTHWNKLQMVGNFLIGLTEKRSLLKAALSSFVQNMETSNAPIVATIFDRLFVIIGLTPLTKGIPILELAKAFKAHRKDFQNFMSKEARAEISYMSQNVFKGKDELATNARELYEICRGEANCPSVTRSKTIEEEVGRSIKDFTNEIFNEMTEASALSRRQESRGEFDAARFYVQCLVCSIISVRSLPSEPTRETPSTAAFKSDKEQVDLKLSITSMVSGAKVLIASNTEQQDSRAEVDIKPALTWSETQDHSKMNLSQHSLVSARTLLRIKSSPSYGTLEVAPGLHPVLQRSHDGDSDPDQFMRHRPFSLDNDLNGETSIAHVFSNNGETWDYFQSLPNDTAILGKGFYLRKTMQGTFALLMATTDIDQEENPDLYLYNIVDTHKLAALHLRSEVILVLECLVQSAYNKVRNKVSETNDMLEIIKVIDHEKEEAMQKFNADSDTVSTEKAEEGCEETAPDNSVLSEDAESNSNFYNQYLVEELFIVRQTRAKLRDMCSGGNQKPLQIVLDDEQRVREFQFSLDVIKSTTSPELRSQLFFILELVIENHTQKAEYHNSGKGDFANRLVAPHAHITQQKFRSAGLKIIKELKEESASRGKRIFVEDFEDSDDEGEPSVPRRRNREFMNASTETSIDIRKPVDDSFILGPTVRRKKTSRSPSIIENKSQKGSLLDYTSTGNGKLRSSTTVVWSLHGDDPGFDLYFVPLDTRQLKIHYSDAHGLPIAYVFHSRLLEKSMNKLRDRELQKTNSSKQTQDQGNTDRESKRIEVEVEHRDGLLGWLAKVARSPLPATVKQFMMNTLRNSSASFIAPHLTRREINHDRSGNGDLEAEDINLLIIANCVAASMPSEEPVRRQLVKVYTLPIYAHKFIERKNDLYGVHIVRRQERQELDRYGITYVDCDLGHDSLINARDDASMYLRIIGCFSEFTWLVWVRGLPTINDQLLKWIAEYTKHHPWRFVYIEDCDTSWNFGENRDRCVLKRAPPALSRMLVSSHDLVRPDLRANRPIHVFEMDEAFSNLFFRLQSSMSWNSLDINLHNILMPARQSEVGGVAEVTVDEDHDLKFLASLEEENNASASPQRTPNAQDVGNTCWLLAKEAIQANDYREQIDNILSPSKKPAIVLLVSPPGAGKSHFSENLGKTFAKEHIGFAYVDGSDDELVDTALATVLMRKVPDEGGEMFLVIDEYHMLSNAHKKELFSWLATNRDRIYALLIANRIDASDLTLLESVNGNSVNARLPRELLNEVIKKRQNIKSSLAIQVWFHLCQTLFGGESISLRMISTLDEAYSSISPAEDLVELLCKKMPRLSILTSRHFVEAYLHIMRELKNSSRQYTEDIPATAIVEVSSSLTSKKNLQNTPVAAMVQFALLSFKQDFGRDFPDFVERDLQGANNISPNIKIAAWCCMMCTEASKYEEFKDALLPPNLLSPETVLRTMFIDQVGFPHQLSDQITPSERICRTFSWGGSYESLEDMTDAVRRGHSINFQDVYEKEWIRNEVVALNEFVLLLSACRSPAVVLRALRKENLVALLQSALSDDVLKLAKYVIRSNAFAPEVENGNERHGNPYYSAVWAVLTCEKKPIHITHLVKNLVHQDDLARALEWAAEHAGSLRATCANDVAKREGTIRTILYGLSLRFIKLDRPERVPALWRGVFAPLLDKEVSSVDMFAEVAAVVSQYETDPQRGWSFVMHKLWALAKGMAHASDLDALLNMDSKLLFYPPEAGEDFRRMRLPYATGLFRPSACQIPLTCLINLLKSNTEVNLEDLGGECNIDQLLEKLRVGIETIAEAKTVDVIQIQPQELQDAVKKAIEYVISRNQGSV